MIERSENVKIGILSNTVSKANRIHGVHRTLDAIIEEMNASDMVRHVCVGKSTTISGPSFDQLIEIYTPAVKQLVEDENADILAIDGGDGTAHIVYSVLMHLYKTSPDKIPAVVHMRGGTINYIADSTDVPKRTPLRWIPHQLTQIPWIGKYMPFKTEHAPEYVLKRLIRTCRNMAHSQVKDEHTSKYRLLKVDDALEDKLGPKKYGLLCAFGAPYNFLKKYYDPETGTAGPYKALKIIAKGIGCAMISNYNKRARTYVDSILEKIKATVNLDEEELSHTEYTGIVSTSKDVRLKLTPLVLRVSKGIDELYTLDRENNSYYGIRAFSANVNIPKLLWTFAKVALPWFTVRDNGEINNRQVREIIISPRTGSNTGYSVEGNLYETTGKVRITPSEVMMSFFKF